MNVLGSHLAFGLGFIDKLVKHFIISLVDIGGGATSV